MNKRGIATTVVLAIIFGISTLGLGSYVVYDKTVNTDSNVINEESINQKETSDNEKTIETTKTDVPIDDLFAYQVGSGTFSILKIDNGTLYADIRSNVSFDTAYDNQKDYDGSSVPKFTKVLDNVKRIKAFHTRTDILISFYAILNDGSVKQIVEENGTVSAREVSVLNDYKIDDIISASGGVDDTSYKIEFNCKLTDGTTKLITT